MNITQLAAKPQLVKLTLDDAETVEKYGESLDFYVWDRQPMERYVGLATAQEKDFGQIINFMKEAILDDTGKTVCDDELILPPDVMMKAMNKVVETLGK